MNAILQVENLTKQYADFKLDHVSFSVPKGTIMGLIGENGAGKSTLIKLCTGQIVPDSGRIVWQPKITIGCLGQSMLFLI